MSLGSGGGRFVRLWRCCLLSVPLGEQAVLRKEVGLLRPGATWPEGASAPNGTVMCRGHGVPEMVTPAMRTAAVLLGCNEDNSSFARFFKLDNDTGNEDNSSFARFFKLDKYAMFRFAMTTGLASDSLGIYGLNLTNMPCSVLP